MALLHGLFGHSLNFGTVQRHLAPRHRTIALDLRNHGASPHAPGMSYAAMAADVVETLQAMAALPCAVVGHSMGGKVAMAMALTAPAIVRRLIVADIAPVAYAHSNARIVATLERIPLTPELTRAAADAMLHDVVPVAATRGFLLQNLRIGEAPSWRIGLPEIAAGMADIEGWQALAGRYDGPTLFIGGDRSDYILPEHRPIIRALFPAAKFVTLKDAGHWLHADNPAGFMALLDAALVDEARVDDTPD